MEIPGITCNTQYMAKNPKRPRDPNQLAKLIVGIATGETKDTNQNERKDPSAVSMGKKGGAARAKTLTSEQRKEIAKRAAKSRWSKKED